MLQIIQNPSALPHVHATVRRKARMLDALPVKLWDRSCEGHQIPFQSRIAPGMPWRILCDECFEQMLLAV